MFPIETAIADAETLAEKCKCEIVIENVAPVYVPEGYESVSVVPKYEQVVKEFSNGSSVYLVLLPF